MRADIMQKCARHQNAYVTTVSFFASSILPLRALTLNTGKQPGMHLRCNRNVIRAHLMPITGHESNGCPHPRTTDSKSISTPRSLGWSR